MMNNCSRLVAFNNLREASRTELRAFIRSPATFHLVRTVPAAAVESSGSCKTLYILDSSFNPPSRAHALLAENAIVRDNGDAPKRILLLLATTNADKAQKPAAFEDRIAMMVLLAETLYSSIRPIPVDVGLTKEPFFVEKAKAIDAKDAYGSSQQVHITGYDTITRIFDPKYYSESQKLGALEPFLSRHRLRVAYRIGDSYVSKEEQDRYLEGIANGSRTTEGVKSEWREHIELTNDADGGVGISSTAARKATVEGNLQNLGNLVVDDIADYIQQMKLYSNDG